MALAIDGEVVAIEESHTQNSHSELITLFCDRVVKKNGITLDDLDAIAVSKGPGSYTGLRIGVSTAKGLCYGLDIPLISINTLLAMAAGIVIKAKDPKFNKESLLCPMIDARRMEVYTALFTDDLSEVEPTSAKIIDAESFSNYLNSKTLIFGGDGAPKCKEILGNNSNAVFLDDFNTSAAYMSKISEQKFNNEDFEDTAYFEPYYLKDFVAGIPKVKGLRM